MSQSYGSSGGALHTAGPIVDQPLHTAGTVVGHVAVGARRFTITGVTVVVADALSTAETVFTVGRYYISDADLTTPSVILGTFTVPVTGIAGDVFTCTEIVGDIQPGEAVKVTTDGGTGAADGYVTIEGYESPVLSSVAGVSKTDSGTGKLYLVAKD